jgi:hypothetical protein
MKIKFTAEITMDIPGEFQDDDLATEVIMQELNERLDIGYEYEKEDQPTFMFLTTKLRSYFVTAGRV